MEKLLSIFLFVLCSSCQDGASKSVSSANKQLIQRDSLSYSYKTFKNVSQYFVENEEQIDSAYYHISYPYFEDTALNRAIHPYIMIDGDDSPELAAESFILGYDEFVEENSTNTINFPWYKNVISKVWTNSPLVLTLATAVDEYTGGAHGNHYTLISNIDITNKKKIEIKDIIEENKIADFTKIAENRFRKQENLSQSSSLEKDFFFENGIFAINDNFGLTKENLVIYYNEYEIRPYADGPTLLEIPYTDFENILSPAGQKYVNSIKQSLN